MKRKGVIEDIFNLTRAYSGALFLMSWGIWSLNNYGVAFDYFIKFITTNLIVG